MVVAIGVFLTVFFYTWVTGIFGDMMRFSANYETGHVKIMTKAYHDNMDQKPNDLAFLGVHDLKEELMATYPELEWTSRIQFGGLVDVANEDGETVGQGPAVGMAYDLLSPDTKEIDRLNIRSSIVKGELPSKQGEIILSDELATKLSIGVGDNITIMTSTMYGGMSFHNYTIASTITFGLTAMDRGAVVMDISDAQLLLDMEDGAGEILGYFKDGEFEDERAQAIIDDFNVIYENSDDEFAPIMISMLDQNDLRNMSGYISGMIGGLFFFFVLVMSIVLWNNGLIGGLRRYGEFGVRLAIGENKSHVYRSLITESVLVGIIGTVIGTAIAISLSYWIQQVGLDFSEQMKSSNMMMPTKFYTKVTAEAFFVGFIPGVLSNVLGAMLSGVGVFRRQTASLFKELEV
jgi:putative ABC transport system permease protein